MTTGKDLLHTLLGLVSIDRRLGGALVAVPGGRLEIGSVRDRALVITPATDPGALTDRIDTLDSFLSGRLIRKSSLLESSSHAIVVIQAGHAMSPAVAAIMAQAIDARSLKPVLLAYDPAVGDLPGSLADRLAFHVALPYPAVLGTTDHFPSRFSRQPQPPDELLITIVDAALRLGVKGHHADTLAIRAAMSRASWLGRPLNEQDVEWAIETVLVPRATTLEHDQATSKKAQQQGPEEKRNDTTRRPDNRSHPAPSVSDSKTSEEPSRAQQQGDASPEGVHATESENLQWAPADDRPLVLPLHPEARAPKNPLRGGGRFGQMQAARLGRIARNRQQVHPGTRIHVIGTLTAAAPWQTIRPKLDGRKLTIYPQDIRFQRLESKPARAHILLLDTSASMWKGGLGQIKAAALECVELAYRNRSRVCLIGIRGMQPSLLLKPGRKYSEARAIVHGLQAGGGTPLVAALRLAADLVEKEYALGVAVEVSIFTDGRRNRLDADKQAIQDAIIADVGQVFQRCRASVVVYGARGPQAADADMRVLAQWLGGEFVRLERRSSSGARASPQ